MAFKLVTVEEIVLLPDSKRTKSGELHTKLPDCKLCNRLLVPI